MDGIELNFGSGTGFPGSPRLSPKQHKTKVAIEAAGHTVLVVNMSNGQVQEVLVPPPLNGQPMNRGDSPVVWANGELQIAKAHKDGFELYRDWCEEEPEKYKIYRDLMVARAKGMKIRVPDPEKLFPKKLLEYRVRAEAGSPDGKAWVPGEGVVADPGPDRIHKAIEELTGLTVPEAERE